MPSDLTSLHLTTKDAILIHSVLLKLAKQAHLFDSRAGDNFDVASGMVKNAIAGLKQDKIIKKAEQSDRREQVNVDIFQTALSIR